MRTRAACSTRLDTTSWEGQPRRIEPHGAGRLSAERSPQAAQKLAVSCGRSPRHTAHLYEAQVLVVAAAGNGKRDSCTGYYDSVTTPHKLLVGSTTEGGELSYFSNYGACVHVQVPPSRSARMRPPASDRPPQRPPASDHTPATTRQRPPTRPLALPHRAPPRTCAGPRLRHPGCGNRPKQHCHRVQVGHQYGGAACLGRRRPGPCAGPDPLGGASEGDSSRRRGGGLPRPCF